VSVVWWTADGGAPRASGGPRLPGGVCAAVGLDRPASAALCPRLGPRPLSCGRWCVRRTGACRTRRGREGSITKSKRDPPPRRCRGRPSGDSRPPTAAGYLPTMCSRSRSFSVQ
jgi:hypothetical protein